MRISQRLRLHPPEQGLRGVLPYTVAQLVIGRQVVHALRMPSFRRGLEAFMRKLQVYIAAEAAHVAGAEVYVAIGVLERGCLAKAFVALREGPFQDVRRDVPVECALYQYRAVCVERLDIPSRCGLAKQLQVVRLEREQIPCERIVLLS